MRQILVLCVMLLGASTAEWSFAQNSTGGLLSLSRLPYLTSGKLIQIASTDTSGGNDDFITIPAGDTATLADIKGPGVIVQLWFTLDSPDRYFLRRILLRMYWDDEETPSVEVPLGDFFGTGFQYKPWYTALLGMSSGGYYSYFPMPFNARARIEVVNETGTEVHSLYYHIDYQQLQEPLDRSEAYFHASWHREIRPDTAHFYTILEAEGEGHLVGVNLNMQSYDGGLGYLEGDELIFVDGETVPSVRGTGTEDFFNSGWYFNRGEFSAPYHGLILKDDTLGRIAAYRFFVSDAISFKKSIRVAIEHGHQNKEIADYSSTAYWYQKEPHRPFPEMLSAALRIPLRVEVPNGAMEAESMHPESTSLSSTVDDMSAYGPDWSGLKQLRVDGGNPGDSFSLTFRAPEERYDIAMYFTKGPAYGDVRIFAGKKELAQYRGFDPEVIPGGKLLLRNVTADNGSISLRFVVSGKYSAATGYSVGLDAFTIKPERLFIRSWDLIGPFPNLRDQSLKRAGLDVLYPPELGFHSGSVYEGVDQQKLRWHRVNATASGFVNLTTLHPSDLVVAYAHTRIHSPINRTVTFLLGSDDGAKVFVNGTEVHRITGIRVAQADQDTIALPLKKGWNSLVLKIENNLGGYGFFARVIDPAHALIFRPSTR
ncbi:MAG: glycoside hydrolase family 172 protein [Bacteroidota bacterium]